MGKSRESTEALLMICNHSVFGFFMQVLILEALDAELGQPTLFLLPPVDKKVDDIEGETRVIYRPRHSRTSETSAEMSSFELGHIDDILSIVSRELGLAKVCIPYEGVARGPWSLVLRLLRSIEIVVGRYDRWTLSSNTLDRLHGGGLLTSVIRKGRNFREELHKVLENLCRTKQREEKEEVNVY